MHLHFPRPLSVRQGQSLARQSDEFAGRIRVITDKIEEVGAAVKRVETMCVVSGSNGMPSKSVDRLGHQQLHQDMTKVSQSQGKIESRQELMRQDITQMKCQISQLVHAFTTYSEEEANRQSLAGSQ